MDLNLLDSIYEEYTYYCLDCGIKEKADASKEFNKKYIIPLLNQNSEKGFKMEEVFNLALSETDAQAFKNGFVACIHLLINCLKSNL